MHKVIFIMKESFVYLLHQNRIFSNKLNLLRFFNNIYYSVCKFLRIKKDSHYTSLSIEETKMILLSYYIYMIPQRQIINRVLEDHFLNLLKANFKVIFRNLFFPVFIMNIKGYLIDVN